MNIDERLEKLAERHEALTRDLEITAAMQRTSTERDEAFTHRLEAFTQRDEAFTQRQEALARRHEALAQTVELMQRDFHERFGQVTHTFEIALDSIKRLENIALAHE